jgi:HEAT repeat protein
MHDWHYFFNHVPHNVDEGTYRIFEPQWKAEILHWFGREDVAVSQKEEFLAALIDFDDRCSDFYRYRAYFLAGEALAHFPESSQADEIVGQLLKWSYIYFQEQQNWQTFLMPLGETARAVLEATDRKRVIAAFVQLLHTTESPHVLRHAAERLGRFDPGNKTAIAALVLLMQVHQDKYIPIAVIRSLKEIGCGNETAIAALIQLLRSARHSFSCWEVVDALGQIGTGDETALSEAKPKAIATLVHLVETTLDKSICYAAIRALGKIAYGNQIAIAALVQLLQTDQDSQTCWEAADALGQIATGNETAIATLVHLVETTLDKSICYIAIRALGKIAYGNQIAIATLIGCLTINQGDNSLFDEAAIALWKIAPDNQLALSEVKLKALAALSQILETDRSVRIRLRVAEQLVQIDPGNETTLSEAKSKAIAALVQILATTQYKQHQWIYLEAAEILVRVEDHRKKALNTLLQLVHFYTWSEGYEYLHLPAISCLERIDPSHQLALNALVHLIKTTVDSTTLSLAARHLAQLDPGNKLAKAKLDEVVATLVQFIETFEDVTFGAGSWFSYESCLLDIADSLRGILQSNHLPQVVTALKDYLGEKFYKNLSCRYEPCYHLIWYCAQNMTYPEFYKAWHNSSMNIATNQSFCRHARW